MDVGPHGDLASELAVSRFCRENPLPAPVGNATPRISSLFGAPGSMGAALETALFERELEEFAEAVCRTTDAGLYLERWDAFTVRFTERAFLARYFLLSAMKFGENALDQAALREIDHLRMLSRCANAFQRLEDDSLNLTWSYDLIGIQAELISNVATLIGSYPEIVRAFLHQRFGADELEERRLVILAQLARLADPLEYLRGVVHSGWHASSLTLALPAEGIDLFTSYPRGEPAMDVRAVRRNVDAFIALRRTVDAIILQAGRNREKPTHLVFRWNDDRGTLTIEDTNPVAGALLPFTGAEENKRLTELAKGMGADANIAMTTVMGATVSKIVLRLPQDMLPIPQHAKDETDAPIHEGFGASMLPPAAGEFDELDNAFAEFEPCTTVVPTGAAADAAAIVSGMIAAGISPVRRL